MTSYGWKMTSSVFKAAAFLLLSTGTALAYDESAAQKTAEEMKAYRFETVTTKEGLTFSIPSDMPIERKDGLVQPIPFEEYLYFRFKKMEERMDQLDRRLDDFEGRLMAKLNEIQAEIAVRPMMGSTQSNTLPLEQENAGA
jgi:hypothetical protein